MVTPRRAKILSAVLAATLVPAYGFVSPTSAVEDFAAASENVTHVAQLPYADARGDGANQGTDLEFTTLTVAPEDVTASGLDATVDADAEAPGLQRTYGLAGAYDNGLQIVDVTERDAPTIVSVYDCGISQADVQVFSRDERTYATFTMDTGYSAHTKSTCFVEAEALGFKNAKRGGFGTFIADVTDPYRPATVSWVEVPLGSHNQTVHPSGDFLYNSNSELITNARNAGIEVYDIRDFANPTHVTTLPLPVRPGLGTDSHDIGFNADGTRAYSAALSQTVIIDTTDPAAPTIVTSFVDPTINVEHEAEPITLTDATTGLERDFLIVEDEFGGATETGQCPNGGVHVYDITGELELAPVKVGYWNIPEVRKADGELAGLGRCTAHVFQLHQDEALMTIAYYNGGVRVVDVSGLIGVALGGTGVGMKEVAYARFADSDTWAVKAPFVDRDGVFDIYGNDQNRGMDVYRIDLSGAPAASTLAAGKQWYTPAEAYELLSGREVPAGYTPYCLLGDRASGA